MYLRVTVTAYSALSLADQLGLEASDILRDMPFIAKYFNPGDVKTFDVSENQWNRLQFLLERLSLKNFPVLDANGLKTGKFRSIIAYSAEQVPGNRPRFLRARGPLSLGSATNTLTIDGENLIRGYAARGSIGRGTAKLDLVAQRKGPEGNNVTVEVLAASGAGSVTTTHSTATQGTTVRIKVVPAAAGPGSNAIAAQINADTLANFYVEASGNGTGTVLAAIVTLSTGEGAGIAYEYFTNEDDETLFITARKPGNGGNHISIKINAASGAGSVSVTGSAITVVPAAAGDTIDDVVTQINANAAAAALVEASGTGSASTGVIAQTWLHGGCGEDAVLKVGSVTAVITAYSDTQIVATVDGTVLSGYAAADQAVINLFVGFSKLSMQYVIAS